LRISPCVLRWFLASPTQDVRRNTFTKSRMLQSAPPSAPPRRPRLFVFVLLLFCFANMFRAVLAFQQNTQLPQLPVSPSPLYEAVASAAWALIFGICIAGAWLRSRWAAWAAILASVLNQAHVWVDRLAFSRSTESFQTLGFAAALSAILLLSLVIPATIYHLNKKTG
jgi:hypothetical protein